MPSRRAKLRDAKRAAQENGSTTAGDEPHSRSVKSDDDNDEDELYNEGAAEESVFRGHDGRGPLPASDTKHLACIEYWLPNLDCTLTLQQVAGNGSTTGSTLWLSSQILACYLQSQYDKRRTVGNKARPRAIELGAGIGLTSLVLAQLGWDVVSTDVAPPLDTVLRPNILTAQQASVCKSRVGNIDVQKYDWVQDDPSSLTDTPFDLIVTADTVYEPSLVDGMFHTIAVLLENKDEGGSLGNEGKPSRTSKSPLKQRHALIALERRDPQHIDMALARARSHHGLALHQVGTRKVRAAVDAYLGAIWPRSAWDDVEIWIATRVAI